MNPNERDERLERLLVGLGTARADSGFERRVLHGVALRSQATPARRSPWAWAASLACAVGVGVAVHGLHRSAPERPQVAALPTLHGSVTPVPTSLSQTFRDGVAEGVPARRQRVMANANRLLPVTIRGAEPSANEAMTSFPAPPLPLTEQERLLLRIAHKADPVEMAMLDPAVRAKHDAEDVADYREFFKPPPPQPTADELVKALEMKEKGDQ